MEYSSIWGLVDARAQRGLNRGVFLSGKLCLSHGDNRGAREAAATCLDAGAKSPAYFL